MTAKKGGEILNDEQLVALCKIGEKQAFEELIRRYYLPLNKFFYKLLKDALVCEDLSHDVIIKLIENIEKYKFVAGVKFSTWLFKIAYNRYIDYLKKSPVNRETCLDEAATELPSAADTHDSACKNMESSNLRLMLNQLPGEMKTLIILRYYNDFSYSEIGEIMGMSLVTVKWKLHNSVKKLKSLLVDNGGVDI
jgi:RNA polymerase sigma-70 factor, ECF subfamily